MGTEESSTEGYNQGEIQHPRISEKEASVLMQNFKSKFKHEKISGSLISASLLQEFVGIPNFQGISFYQGLTDDGEFVSILVGVTEVDGKRHNVYNYAFNINNATFTQPKPLPAPVIMMVSKQPPPCPPLPPNTTRCP